MRLEITSFRIVKVVSLSLAIFSHFICVSLECVSAVDEASTPDWLACNTFFYAVVTSLLIFMTTLVRTVMKRCGCVWLRVISIFHSHQANEMVFIATSTLSNGACWIMRQWDAPLSLSRYLVFRIVFWRVGSNKKRETLYMENIDWLVEMKLFPSPSVDTICLLSRLCCLYYILIWSEMECSITSHDSRIHLGSIQCRLIYRNRKIRDTSSKNSMPFQRILF